MNSKINEITKEGLEDFKKVYRVFSGAPYYEKYTDEELEKIFLEYLNKGYIYGAYSDDICVGIVALERGAKEEHPIKFEDGNIMYLADIAVLDDYRNNRIGYQLMLYGVMQSKQMGFDKLYMRTLKKGSMSLNIAKRIGFTQIQNVTQEVEKERINGLKVIMQNIFLEIDLKELSKDKLKQAMQATIKESERSDRIL